uniref:Uncharacterized protein n=1 Tax=Rhizophora mucronata TaxID=61149 RepID=A0A2P2P3E0_RHIMU
MWDRNSSPVKRISGPQMHVGPTPAWRHAQIEGCSAMYPTENIVTQPGSAQRAVQTNPEQTKALIEAGVVI